MLFNIECWSTEKYLPSKRFKNLRTRSVENNVRVEVKEPTESEFPIAFVVHDYQSVYDDATSYSNFEGRNEYKMFSEEIRTYKGKLYTPVRITHGAAISLHFENFNYIEQTIKNSKPFYSSGNDFTENSIIKETDIKEVIKLIKNEAREYVIFDGKVWKECGEPMYNITTFGLGHNHGGTGFFIDYNYNPNIRKENYFNALERDQAIAYGKQTALNRGDTKSVEGMGEHDIIEVLIPEMVKRKPGKEHGNGGQFLNCIEDIINNSDSVTEAGLLAMVATLYST